MTDRERTLKDIISDITEQELAENCPTEPITREELHRKIKENRKRRLRKPIALAVIAAVIAVGFIALWPMLSPQDVNVDADKNGKEEILTDDGVIIEDKGWGSSSEDEIVITEWEDIPIVKSQIDELLVPGYIPEGYEFEELRVEKVEQDGITAIYSYESKGALLTISEHFNNCNVNSQMIFENSNDVSSNKGIIYYGYDDDNILATIEIYDGVIIDVYGNINIQDCKLLIERLN